MDAPFPSPTEEEGGDMPVSREIVHYDLANIYYSSFFITGFSANAARLRYRFQFAKDVPAILTHAFGDEERLGNLRFILLFQARLGPESFYFCIDTRDSADVLPRGEGLRHLPLLDVVKYYFKVNFSQRLVDSDPDLSAYASKILPAAPFFPVATQAMRLRLPRLTPYPAALWGPEDVLLRFKGNTRMRPPQHVLKLRQCTKTHDVFFVSTYYPEANHAPWMEFRYETMREIRRQAGIRSICGFVSNSDLPGKFADLRLRKLPFARYMRSLAAAKIAVYVRGLHDCVSFKFSEFLALGLPIVGQSVVNDVEVILRSGQLREQLRFDTPKEIVERVGQLLANDAERAALAAENMRLFDSHLSPEVVTRRILDDLGFCD
jgi:Glycosyl transferases group 1